MPPSDKAGRVVFVGNIPYGIAEELIVETLSRVGEVLSFRLVYDQQTGKPKGFGFAEYSDPDAAASAVRNLNDHMLQGRKLRVDWSKDGGANDSAPDGYDLPVTNGQDMAPQAVAAQSSQSTQLPPLPPGAKLPEGIKCTDAISSTLSTLPAGQLLDIIVQMKEMVNTDPEKASALLRQAPQLSYAIFQALLLLGLVDTNILTSLIEQAASTTPQPQTQPQMPQVAQQYTGYVVPTPQPASVATPPVATQPYAPPAAPQQPPNLDPGTWELYRQVMALTDQQINQLGPNEREQILNVRRQYQMLLGQMR